jgi:CRISPR system Cascade subunit CasD
MALLLCFDAPLVSFGTVAVDQHGVVQRFPSLSMITGICANALGWRHDAVASLQALQGGLRYAARLDRPGEALVDYQTVDLGASWMRAEVAGWTTRGRVVRRDGSEANRTGTHQRYRHYRADSVTTVALGLESESPVSLDALAHALRVPARPLFLGRKSCLPAARLLVGTVEAASLLVAVATAPRHPRADAGPLPATWWANVDDNSDGLVGAPRLVAVTDERDWRNRIHVGRRVMREGLVDPPQAVS